MQVSDWRTFGATKTNQIRRAFNRSSVRTGLASQSADWNNSFGLPNGNLSNDASTKGLAEFNMSGTPSIATPDWVGYIVSNTISATDNFTWTKGKHQFKFGANINHVVDVSADTIGGDDPRGTLSFSEAMTSFDGIGYNSGSISAETPSIKNGGFYKFFLGNKTSWSKGRFF